MNKEKNHILAQYKAEVEREKRDLELEAKNIKTRPGFSKWLACLPTGNIIIYTDNISVVKNMRLRNFIIQDTFDETKKYDAELFFLKNSVYVEDSLALCDDNNNIGVVFGKKIFEPGILTGFASKIWAKENNINKPVFVHGSLIEIIDESNNKKNILLAGAHGYGKSFATLNTINHILNSYPKYKVYSKGDDWYILRKNNNGSKINAKTTDPSIAIDKNILDNPSFSNLMESYEDNLVCAINNNKEIKSYLDSHFYNLDKRDNFSDNKRGKLIGILKNILKDTSNKPKQLNLFHDIDNLLKKISLPANITIIDRLENDKLIKDPSVLIDSIIVLYPNNDSKELYDIDDMANIIAEGASNHYPLTREELPLLVNHTKNLLSVLTNNPMVYNYKLKDNLAELLNILIL